MRRKAIGKNNRTGSVATPCEDIRQRTNWHFEEKCIRPLFIEGVDTTDEKIGKMKMLC